MVTNFTDSVQQSRDRLGLGSGSGVGSDTHDRLLDFIRKIKRVATDAITDQVDLMRKADSIYHAFRRPDEQDEKSVERGEPVKIVYPVTYAQIQTTLTALMSIYDRKPFFPLESRQPQFYRNSKLMESELEYQCDQAGLRFQIYLFLQDMLKYGFAYLHVGYERKMVVVTQKRPVPILGSLLGMTQNVTEPVVGYEGAAFELNDPYQFKFDPAFSIGEFQKGSYVCNNFRISFNDLKLLSDDEDEGYFNIDLIPERTAAFMQKTGDRGREREFLGEDAKSTITHGRSEVKGGDTILIDQFYVKLVPAQYKLSDTNRVQIWKISMANEAVIIQCEPSRFEHGMFPGVVGEYNPDRHEITNDGMAQVADGLQDLINWHLNTRMTFAKRILNEVLVVDPAAFEVSDLTGRKPIIRLKRPVATIDKVIKQLPIQDISQYHIRDSEMLLQVLQRTLGINDNTAGVQFPTVRTATEVSTVKQASLGRVGLLAELLWEQAFKPLGQQMIQNTQQFCKSERFIRVNGPLALSLGIDPSSIQGGMVGISPQELMGFFSIKMIDVTTPNEDMVKAGILKEVVMAALSNPQVIPMLGIDVSQALTQSLMLSGVKNTSDFIRPPRPDMMEKLLVMLIQNQGNPKAGTGGVQAKVMPDEKVQDEVQRGNLIPMDAAGGNGNGRI